MRVAVIVMTMLVVPTPSEASRSCMSKTEARQHFGYCWDATPERRQPKIRKVVQRKINQPKWHDLISEMLRDEEPVQTTVQMPWVDRWVDIEPSPIPLVARRVDIVQAAPAPVIEREPEAMASPSAVVLVFIAIVLALTLATIEVLFRGTIYERPKSTTKF
jgi:hypothetical protein